MTDTPDNLHVIDHPLIAYMLTEARDRRTDPLRFRQLLSGIGTLLAYEATRDFVTTPQKIQTPLESATGSKLRHPVTIVPILRAGLIMADGVLSVLPQAHVGHIGMYRDEQKLEPVSYYRNLPPQIAQGPAILVDPMLATGGSALAGIQLLRDHHCTDIRLICLVAAPPGVQRLNENFPDVPIYTAALDRQLDDRGYILPGLGDAGDRMFGTLNT